MELPLLNPVKVVEIVSSYETYTIYPYVYYINMDSVIPEISEIPGKESKKIEAYVVNVSGYILVLQFIGDTPVIEAFDSTSFTPVDVTKPLDMIHSFLEGKNYIPLNTHERQAISRLFYISEEDVRKIEETYNLRKLVRGAEVSIIGDEVYIIRDGGIIRVDGDYAVDLARKLSVITRSPVSRLVDFITKTIDRPASLISLRTSMLLCNTDNCILLPITRHVARLLSNKLPSGYSLILLNDNEGSRERIVLPKDVDALAISRRSVYLLKRRGRYQYEIVKRYRVSTSFNVPVIYGRRGFIGYGKIEASRSATYIRRVNTKKIGDFNFWEYESVVSIM